MVSHHSQIQHYNRHYAKAVVTGLFGCRWQRYKQSKDETPKVGGIQKVVVLERGWRDTCYAGLESYGLFLSYFLLLSLCLNPVSILGFENCQSFFPATAHVRCTAPARPTPCGRCRSAYIAYFIGKTTLRSSYSLQHASNCIKNTILSLVYIKLVVYYNKRSWKSRGTADLKRNP